MSRVTARWPDFWRAASKALSQNVWMCSAEKTEVHTAEEQVEAIKGTGASRLSKDFKACSSTFTLPAYHLSGCKHDQICPDSKWAYEYARGSYTNGSLHKEHVEPLQSKVQAESDTGSEWEYVD